jgi:hypothetical protein
MQLLFGQLFCRMQINNVTPARELVSFRFDGDIWWTIWAMHVKCGTEVCTKHACKFCIKYRLYVNSYKHRDRANVWGDIWQIKGIYIIYT